MDDILAFLEYIRNVKRYSNHTILSYSTDIHQFLSYCTDKGIYFNPQNVDEKLIREWIVFLISNKISSRSVNRKVTALRSFFRFLLKEKIVEKDPTQMLKNLKTKKKLPSFVTENQMNVMLNEDNFNNSNQGHRNNLIIETFYFTGIRVSELSELKVANIDRYNKTIKVLGKRNKERIVPIHPFLFEKLLKFIEIKDSDQYLFSSKSGNKITPSTIYRIVKSYLSIVTKVEKRGPHTLRHTFATHMLNNGADLNTIKEILGHSNLAATQVYTHNSFEKLINIYKQAHPRA